MAYGCYRRPHSFPVRSRLVRSSGSSVSLMTPVHRPYPDPSDPGVLPGPPYRRFYIGPVHNGPWPAMGDSTYWNWSPIGIEGWSDVSWGIARAISIADPAEAHLDIGPETDAPFTDYWIGDAVFDNVGSIWATIIPWDDAARVIYLYPRPPSATDKIYYADVLTEATYLPSTLIVGDVVWIGYSGDNGYCVLTEMGEDAIGTWFKCRAFTEDWAPAELVVWTAGEIGSTNDGKIFNVMPWGAIIGGPFGP